MYVVGVSEEDRRHVFMHRLDHGADPRTVTFDLGYVVVRPVDALRNGDGCLELRFLVRPATGEDKRPLQAMLRQDLGIDADGLRQAEVRQRVAAYALVRSERGLLATQFSQRTGAAGRWGLPGGGIDDHEQPTDAVLREVAEETQQAITLGELVEVQTAHWIGRSPRDTIEDYHAVRLVYTATCEHPTDPEVADLGGTTESAQWVRSECWQDLDWTVGWHQILSQLVDRAS